MNVNVIDVTIPQKVEITKAALLSDYITLVKVDIASKPIGDYPMIEPISLISI